MPTARNHAAVGAVNDKIYVIGGRLGSAFIFTASNTNVHHVLPKHLHSSSNLERCRPVRVLPGSWSPEPIAD